MQNFALIPPDLTPWAAAIIVAASFFASAITAALSIGGGVLLVGVMSTLAPPAAVIPVHGAIMAGSNGGRAAVLRAHVDWVRVISFATGAAVGAVIGGLVVTGMPANVLRIAIAGFILFSQWGPSIPLPSGRHAFRIVGGISTVLTLFVGATGPFVTTLLSKIDGLTRQALVGTAGACMTVQHTLKVAVFGIAGFAFAPWLGLIAMSLVAGFAGTVLGAKLLGWVPEQVFRRGLKYVLTAMAFYLIALAAAGLVRTG